MTEERELTRPPQVLWALRLWVTSGLLLAVLGGLTVIVVLVRSGEIDTVGVGALLCAIGIGYCLAARKLAAAHDLRVRSALAVTTLVVVVLLLMASLLSHDPSYAITLVIALLGLFGSLLAYRPDSEAWFAQEDRR